MIVPVAVVAVVGLGFANVFVRVVPLWVGHAAIVVAMVLLIFGYLLPRSVFRHADRPPPVVGDPVARARCSGTIGRTPLTNMMLVTAYADRLVVRVTLAGSGTIMADRITSVRDHAGGWYGWRGIEITHTAAGVVSPVVLALREGHHLREAVESLARDRPA